MKKKLISLMLTGIMALSLVACGGNSGTAQNGGASAGGQDSAGGDGAVNTLSVTAWDANFNIPALRAAEADYQKNVNPDFKLEINEVSASRDVENFVTLAGSSTDYSNLTDIILFQDHYFNQYVTNYPDAFIDVNDASVNWDDFGAEKLSYSTFDGKHYGFPVDNGTVIFAYRTDLLEEAGHSIDEMKGISWADFIKVGEDVYAKSGKYLLSMEAAGNDLPYMMLQAEKTSQFKDGKPFLADNATLVQILEVLEEMQTKNVLYLANDWSGYTDQTIKGDMVAGVMNGNWIIPTIEQVTENSGKWAITSMPTLKGGEGFASNGGSSLYITANCSNPELAKDFLAKTFGGSVETYDAALKNGGVITTCISAGQSDVYKEGVEYFGGQAIYAQIVEMGKNVPVIEQNDFHYTCREQVSAAIVNIHNGTSVADALKEAQDKLQFAMDGQ